jgi:hypothetical protein
MDIKTNKYVFCQVFTASGLEFAVKKFIIFGDKKEARSNITTAFKDIFPSEDINNWKLSGANFYPNNYKKDSELLVSQGLYF